MAHYYPKFFNSNIENVLKTCNDYLKEKNYQLIGD